MLFSASMAVPKNKNFHFMACGGIIIVSFYTGLATREYPQRELGLKGDLMQLTKIQLSTLSLQLYLLPQQRINI